VKKIDATTMNLSATAGGAVIPYGSTSGSGTQTMTFATNKLLLTFADAHGYDTGDAIQVESSNELPTGLSTLPSYYVQKRSDTSMYLSTLSLVTSPAIDYTDAGLGNVTINSFVPTLVDEAVKLNTIDFSVGGSRIGNTLGRKDVLIAAIQRVVAEGSRPIVTYMAGMNDLILGSLLTPPGQPSVPITSAELVALVELLKDYWDDIRAAGAKLIVCTVTAANVGGELSGHYSETLRTELNNLIRSASDHYDALADFGATPQVGTWTDPAGVSYFFDDIHPDFQGHIVMSNILSPLVDAFRL
jgi:lysophospholipase L1-like esterase